MCECGRERESAPVYVCVQNKCSMHIILLSVLNLLSHFISFKLRITVDIVLVHAVFISSLFR